MRMRWKVKIQLKVKMKASDLELLHLIKTTFKSVFIYHSRFNQMQYNLTCYISSSYSHI